MLPFLDSLVANIAPEMVGQVARWGGSVAGWEANVQVMRDFIETRCVTIQEGMVDCYDLEGPFNVVFKVEPPLTGNIEINSITPDVYPFEGVYYGGINTNLYARAAEGWTFDHWESQNHLFDPSMTDTIVDLLFTTTDTIIAHFAPPIKYNVVLMVDPPNAGTITYDGTHYTVLPATVEVLPEAVDTVTIHPAMYYDFLYWELKYNLPNNNDTTLTSLPVTIFQPDTIIAHLQPQDYVYWSPNAFTPDGDGLNDTWRPWNNVLDLTNYDLRVFDRWGREVFASTDPYKTWDGKVDGAEMPSAVYAFRARMTDALTRDEHEVVGHVTVVR
jgi:gliding motility-associated-like protein